ncbi:hypothetical protein BVG81_008640, partial [Haliangium sp. UPWRP_2]
MAVLALLVTASPRAEAQVVRIRVAPPAPRVEVRAVAPSPRHVWIPGYWQWGGQQHVWVAGRYDLPPATGQVWVEERWVNEGGQWVFYQGHWGHGGPAVVVRPAPPAPVIVQPAPPPRVVVQPAPPPVVVVRPGPVVIPQPPPPGPYYGPGH